MCKLEQLVNLEKCSSINLAYVDILADLEDESTNTRKRILQSRIDGRYLYHEMQDGEVIKCFEMALSWEPFPEVKIFAFTPDNLHICEMDSRLPGLIEWKSLKTVQIVPGMAIEYRGNTITFVDDSSIKVNARKVQVAEDSTYVVKYLKTKIKAIDGARGLFRFLENEVLTSGYSMYANKCVELYA